MAKSDATRKPKTHFEQVPVDVAKKIAEKDAEGHTRPGAARAGARRTPRKKG